MYGSQDTVNPAASLRLLWKRQIKLYRGWGEGGGAVLAATLIRMSDVLTVNQLATIFHILKVPFWREIDGNVFDEN